MRRGLGLIANVLPLEWRTTPTRNRWPRSGVVRPSSSKSSIDFAAAAMEAFAGLYGLSSMNASAEHIATQAPPETADHLRHY